MRYFVISCTGFLQAYTIRKMRDILQKHKVCGVFDPSTLTYLKIELLASCPLWWVSRGYLHSFCTSKHVAFSFSFSATVFPFSFYSMQHFPLILFSSVFSGLRVDAEGAFCSKSKAFSWPSDPWSLRSLILDPWSEVLQNLPIEAECYHDFTEPRALQFFSAFPWLLLEFRRKFRQDQTLSSFGVTNVLFVPS